MMVCDTLANIEIGVKMSDCTFITWREILARAKTDKPLNLPFSFSYRLSNGSIVNRHDQRLIPDGLFGIRYPNGKAAFYLLETEHGNPIIPSEDLKRASFFKKYLGYKDMRKQGTFEKQLGIKAVRVLFVVPTKAKAQTMIKFVEKDMGESTQFLFADVPVQEDIMGAPPPFPELFTGEWLRAGLRPTTIHSVN